MKQYNNSQKRIYELDKICFVVTKTWHNFPYFKEPIFCQLLIEELKICKQLKKFKLFAWSIMYDHVNLLIQPSDEFNISKIIKSLKENVSRDINNVIFNKQIEGDTSTCRLQIRELILNFKKLFQNKYYLKSFPKFQWQASFHDHIIRNGQDFLNHYNYTIYNFQKHNLPSNWPYTSLNDKSDLTDSADFWLFD